MELLFQQKINLTRNSNVFSEATLSQRGNILMKSVNNANSNKNSAISAFKFNPKHIFLRSSIRVSKNKINNLQKKSTKMFYKIKKTSQFFQDYYLLSQAYFKSLFLGKSHEIFSILLTVIYIGHATTESPFVDPKSSYGKTLHYTDIVLNSVYIIELILIIHAFGLLYNSNCYLRKDYFDIIHFANAIITILDVFFYSEKIFVSLKSFRALYFAKFLYKKNSNFRNLSNTFFKARYKIINLCLCMGLFLLIFSVITTELMKGKLYYCINVASNYINKYECFDNGGDWINRELNFDNVLESYLTLFQVLFSKNWSFYM